MLGELSIEEFVMVEENFHVGSAGFTVMERLCFRLAYGEQLTYDIFYFISLGKKHANIINQQNFLESCRNENLIPKSLRYKLHLNTRKEAQFAHTLQLKTLVHIIKDKQQKRHIISSERKSFFFFLLENLSTVDFAQVVRLERKTTSTPRMHSENNVQQW